MAWESCILLLNSDSTGSFYTGDIVTGSAILEFKKTQKIDHIDFKVTGVSKAQWTRPMPTIPYIKIYSEKRKLLHYEIDVFRELDGKVIKPGILSFHFHFMLPNDLPSTFESSIAKVCYYIKIEGKSSFKFTKKKIVPFVVQGNININSIDDYLMPSIYESQKSFWNSGTFSIRFKTYKGFAPKQLVPFHMVIVNEKKVKMSKINVILIQKLRYNVSSGFADEERKIYKVVHKKFSNTVTETCNFGMEIPHTIPSSIHITNAMIEVSYIFRVEVIFAFYSTLFEDIPVTIATIPVMHFDFEERK